MQKYQMIVVLVKPQVSGRREEITWVAKRESKRGRTKTQKQTMIAKTRGKVERKEGLTKNRNNDGSKDFT